MPQDHPLPFPVPFQVALMQVRERRDAGYTDLEQAKKDINFLLAYIVTADETIKHANQRIEEMIAGQEAAYLTPEEYEACQEISIARQLGEDLPTFDDD